MHQVMYTYKSVDTRLCTVFFVCHEWVNSERRTTLGLEYNKTHFVDYSPSCLYFVHLLINN